LLHNNCCDCQTVVCSGAIPVCCCCEVIMQRGFPRCARLSFDRPSKRYRPSFASLFQRISVSPHLSTFLHHNSPFSCERNIASLTFFLTPTHSSFPPPYVSSTRPIRLDVSKLASPPRPLANICCKCAVKLLQRFASLTIAKPDQRVKTSCLSYSCAIDASHLHRYRASRSENYSPSVGLINIPPHSIHIPC